MEKEKEKREAAEHSCVLRVMFALRRERFLSDVIPKNCGSSKLE
jgi:hypothetical protein